MAIKGERALLLKLIRHSEILSNIFGKKIMPMYLEFNISERKVDMLALIGQHIPLFIETQIDTSKTSMEKHRRQIELLLKANIGQVIVAWIAPQFDIEIVERIFSSFVKENKKLELILIQISQEAVDRANFSVVDEINVEEGLNAFSLFENDFKILWHIKNMNPASIEIPSGLKTALVKSGYGKSEYFLREIIEYMKEHCQMASLYNYKMLNTNDFSIGLGFNDVSVRVTLKKMKQLNATLHFTGSQKRLYPLLKIYKEYDCEKLEYLVKYDDNKETISFVLPFWNYSNYLHFFSLRCIHFIEVYAKRITSILDDE